MMLTYLTHVIEFKGFGKDTFEEISLAVLSLSQYIFNRLILPSYYSKQCD